jgi:hypothetical protein
MCRKQTNLSVESLTGKPYTQTTEITIPLTNANVDIVEFHRSFFTLYIDFWLNFDSSDLTHFIKTDEAVSDNVLDLLMETDLFFVGFKNATDCIDSYRIQHEGVDIGATMQNKAQIESFLYNQMKPMIEKSNKHGSYSLWEDVQKADEGVCGVYLT